MKTAGLLLLFSVCSAFGILASVGLKKRILAYEGILYLINGILDDIGFLKRDIFTVISEKGEKSILFKGVQHNDEVLYTYYLKAVETNAKGFCLKTEDFELLDRFFSELGKGDTESQIRLCKLVSDEISSKLGLLRTDYGKRSALYRTVGMCTGLIAVILLV